MTILFSQRVVIPDDVLIRELDGESVLLNLATDSYFGLDAVGTDMWRALAGAASIQDAYDAILADYEVNPETLLRDLVQFIQQLQENGLIALSGV